VIEPDGMGGGAITGQYDYEPFGKVSWQSGPSKRLGFIDKEKDKESSLGDFGVRKYDDVIGRFTSIDPLWEKYRSLTPYQYCRNNPLNLVDPSGMGDEPIPDSYKGKKVVAPATPLTNPDGSPNLNAYNCHSDAWCEGKGDPSDPANASLLATYPRWDQDPTNNAEQSIELNFDQPNYVGDRVVYYGVITNKNPDGTVTKSWGPTHSGIVTKVDKDGNAIEVTSKWGAAEKYVHHPRDVPAIYGSKEPTTVYSGQTLPSRIYYRPLENSTALPGPGTPFSNVVN